MGDVPQTIAGLIERFGRNVDAYRAGHYNETAVRRDFIDPLFEALGWDMNNSAGCPEAYRDVIHEDAISVGGRTKAPDYCFRIGGTRKFFVEAKKPSINIAQDVHPAYQLRRYAWSAKLPLSILTDFEEFAVYDCRVRPKRGDNPAVARTMYFTYTQYADKWNEIADIFAKDAIFRGSFDKYVVGRKKRGTAEVDAEFLKEIENWRRALASNIALRNGALSVREINFAVQRTIDRIIFLRMAEDRGVEEYATLQALINGREVYARLMEMFRVADDRYNSGLFHFNDEPGRDQPPDTLTPGLTIDDKVLKDIFRALYYPDSPYEFSVLPADILGNVYEQFLGKVIHLTKAHHARIEEKPEVKKAGGVYYTPKYIVDYIVKHTVGKLVEGRTPQAIGGLTPGLRPSKKAQPLRILDPACGSGSFLLGAYRFLLDYHRDWYVADGPEKHTKRIYQGAGGQWYLATDEKKRILLSNIYGVDIDSQAVEVTKLNLLLCVLENESQGSVRQLALIHQRVLPDLSDNIKCGNSLIGPDFYEGKQLALFDDETRYRINAFDWHAEFPNVFKTKNPGFDAVIGNPPYVRMEAFKELKDYLKTYYSCHADRSDLYAYFIEKEHSLLRTGGVFGMIVSNKFLRAKYGRPLRKFISQNASVVRVIDFAGLPVFPAATVRTIVVITTRGPAKNTSTLYSSPVSPKAFEAISSGTLTVEEATDQSAYEVSSDQFTEEAWTFPRHGVVELLEKCRQNASDLETYCDRSICMGIKSGLTEAFVIDSQVRDDIITRNPQAREIIRPFINGRNIRRYHVQLPGLYLLYTYHGVEISKYPAVREHLNPYKPCLTKRATKQEWYELQQPQHRYSKFLEKPKIVFPDMATMPRFALDETGAYGSNTVYFIPKRDLFLLGLLNSKLGFFYFSTTCAGLEGKGETYLRFFGQYLKNFPVRTIDFADATDKSRHDRMVELVERMLQLHKELPLARTDHDKTFLTRQIAATDNQIDRLVYELYGLTEEEIAIVEEGTG